MSKQVRARMSAKMKIAVKTAYGSLMKGESVPESVGLSIIEGVLHILSVNSLTNMLC